MEDFHQKGQGCLDKAEKDLYENNDNEKYITSIRECLGDNFYQPISTSLELVFGAKTSPGFICGVKEAVVYHMKKLPGWCCLDAPYELEGSAWGQKVSIHTISYSWVVHSIKTDTGFLFVLSLIVKLNV